MKKMIVLLSVGFMAQLALVTSVHATATTHIWAPSTDVQAFKKPHITADVYIPTENLSDDSRPNAVTNTGLTVGVLPFKKLNAEVGFDYKTGLGDLDNYPVYFNSKVGVPENAFGNYFPALAVGIYDIGTKTDKTNYNVVYGKAAKTFDINGFSLGRFSAGYFIGNDKLLLHGEKEDEQGVLLAWERVFTEISDRLWGCVEYQGSRSAYGTLNLGLSWKFTDNVSAIVGYDIYNDRDLADTVTIQLDVDF